MEAAMDLVTFDGYSKVTKSENQLENNFFKETIREMIMYQSDSITAYSLLEKIEEELIKYIRDECNYRNHRGEVNSPYDCWYRTKPPPAKRSDLSDARGERT
eukprot:485002_1